VNDVPSGLEPGTYVSFSSQGQLFMPRRGVFGVILLYFLYYFRASVFLVRSPVFDFKALHTVSLSRVACSV